MANMCTYDANEIIITVSAYPISAGRDQGEFLALATDTDEYTKTVGAGGETVLNRSNDGSVNATLTLMKSSLSNDFLSGLVTLDRQTPGGIIYPFMVKHVSGSSVLVAEKAKIVRTPRSSASYGQEVGTYEWGLVLSNVVDFFGGQTAPQATIQGV